MNEDCFYYCLERNIVVVLFGTLKVYMLGRRACVCLASTCLRSVRVRRCPSPPLLRSRLIDSAWSWSVRYRCPPKTQPKLSIHKKLFTKNKKRFPIVLSFNEFYHHVVRGVRPDDGNSLSWACACLGSCGEIER